MKKIWGFKKQEDGTLMITSYKGEALDVVIPDTIGKIPVTALSSDVFNPTAPRVTREQAEVRQNLRSVEVCGSVGSIPRHLFGGIYSGYIAWKLPNLKRVVLGEGIQEIGDGAFSGCTGLKEVVLPQNLTTLEYGTFMGCTGLEKVVLPQSLTILEYGVFYSCTALQIVQLPQGVLKIGPCAFYNCKSLKQVSLPESVTEIGTQAFDGCSNLSDIILPAGIKKIENDSFEKCKKLTIHAPAGSYAEQYAKENNIPFVAE